MRISVDNRHRIVLLLFVILDHLVWLYAGHWEQASFAYVVMTECIRIFVGMALVASFFDKKILEPSVNIVLAYCVIMMLLNIFGSTDKVRPSDVPGTMDNIFWFKKDRLVSIDHGFLAVVFYLYFILSTYFFSGKYIDPEIIVKNK
ncbi:hypothetical protein [Desulfovibrio sp. 86]|uniref:Uncharacterized protein n=1 Tax=uncultured Desulfovibrio sp. TaxID=167968 RepID=A0A212L8U8_9BACT|nr:hypothetical protein [Desulfovibrio sp. 86]SCM73940.1 conserved membrane hypothetical protein [uncultured Desulfovibrio sp.]VZH34540.1 conserved membrane protein of unknown function [Desulfovibrio sp. 86]